MSAITAVTALPLLILGGFCVLLSVFVDMDTARSGMAGGLAVIVPNAVFAALAFRHAGARQAQRIVRSFYLGEALKLFLTAGLLICVFVWVEPLVAWAVFVGFLLSQLSCGIAATRMKKFLPNRRT